MSKNVGSFPSSESQRRKDNKKEEKPTDNIKDHSESSNRDLCNGFQLYHHNIPGLHNKDAK